MVAVTTSTRPHAEAERCEEQPGASRAWKEISAEFPQRCAHEVFEDQAGRAAETTALVFGEMKVSYGELNERANRVANYLRKVGVTRDVLVGVCIERSPEMVVALLAVWKAGGAYVPLDPTYPRDRLSFMVEDASPLVILTQKNKRDLLPAGDNCICIDTQWSLFNGEAASNPEREAKLDDLAYVIYTSGSTGRPKGAMIEHRGLINYLWWAIGFYGVVRGSIIPVHTSISFDLTVTSLYTALLAGATVELLGDDYAAQSLLAALRKGERGLVKITPAHLELLNHQVESTEAAGMTKTFVIGGENLLAESLRLWRESAPRTRLINEYGPTETVVGCCIYEVGANDPWSGSVPIGRPIANTQLHILDDDMKPLPVGMMGELFIGGVGVSRGYLKRPDLTAERFLKDPFSSHPGARLYKSGDLARYRADGVIEYLGRVDDQVKVRGYRIELGEIESALAAYPSVQSCTVVAREDEPGNRKLVAYVVSSEGTVLAPHDVREFLLHKLPEYMVPTHFEPMASLPLTLNGKVDRKALPQPSAAPSGASKRELPITETEKKVAEIWRDLLRLETISPTDDFFEIGGTSLTATALIQRLSKAFGVDFKLQHLFERPSTLSELASVVDMLRLTTRNNSPESKTDREEFDL
jgi:amino acid adenylation domain-containing protein